MEKKFKDKVKYNLSKGVDAIKYNIKNVYQNITFSSLTSLFYVVMLPDNRKVNKMFSGIYDESKKTIYIKAKDNKKYQDYLKENTIIKLSNKEYVIDNVDLETIYDYLLQVNKEYKAVSCYKIKLKENQV